MQKKYLFALLILILMATVSCATTAGTSDDAIQKDIVEQVRTAFPTLPISVQVMNGMVTLSGVVDTVEQRRTIVQLARNTEGVRGVSNNLGVRP